MGRRKGIYISLAEAKAVFASKNKRRIDAYSWSVLCKGEFNNSILYQRTHRELRAYFHVGNSKVKNLVNDSLDYGYMCKNAQGNLQVRKLHVKEYCIWIAFPRYRSKERKGGSAYRLKDIKDAIREAIALKKIVFKEHIENIKSRLSMRHDENITYEQYKKCRKTMRMCSSDKFVNLYGDLIAMTEKENLEHPLYSNKGISHKSFAKAMGVCVSTARKKLRGMASKGIISIATTLKTFCSTDGVWSQCDMNDVMDWDTLGGYLFHGTNENKLYLQCSNVYSKL